MVISVDDFESLQMTRELLAEPGAVQDILAADQEISAGDYHTLDEMRAVLEERQRQEDAGALSDAYSARLAPGVLRTLQAGPPRGIPLNAAWAIFEFIHGPLSQDPWRVSKPVHDELEGFGGARRGEYRVVLRIDEEQRIARVVRVDHRSDIYRPA
jgi:mRNA interferase RelE/StbE